MSIIIMLVLEQWRATRHTRAGSSYAIYNDQFGIYLWLPLKYGGALVQHPQALAMSLFKFEMSIDYLSRIESEFPVFWEFYPLQKLNVPSISLCF